MKLSQKRVKLSFVAVIWGACFLLWSTDVRAESIVLLKNTSGDPYDQVANYLNNKFGALNRVLTYSLEGMGLAEARETAKVIRTQNPKLVFALGDKSAFVAKNLLGKVPTVFALIVNWERVGFDRKWVTGIKQNLEPETVFSQLKLFFPGKHRVGVIYSTKSRQYVENAMQMAGKSGLTVIPVFVQETDDFEFLLGNLMKRVDIFWHVEDPLLVTDKNLKLILREAAKKKTPTVTYSTALVKGGFLMSINVDLKDVAQQAASKGKSILEGKTPQELAVTAPEKATVHINKSTLKQWGGKIDPMVLDFATLVNPKKMRWNAKKVKPRTNVFSGGSDDF